MTVAGTAEATRVALGRAGHAGRAVIAVARRAGLGAAGALGAAAATLAGQRRGPGVGLPFRGGTAAASPPGRLIG